MLLAEAYQILEEERCGQCGLPRYICHSDDPGVHFDVSVDTCETQKAVETYRKNHSSGDKGYVEAPGTQLQPKPVMEDPERDFTELRRPFYEAEAERLADPS